MVSSQERRAAVVPRINRLSSAFFVPPSVYIGFRLFVLLKKRSGHLCTMPWRVRGTVVSWATRSVGVPSCPTPPSPAAPPCAAPTRPACGISWFWIRQVGLHKVSFVRASEETFRTVVYGAPEGGRDGCILREPTRRHLVLPRTALPLRRALPWYVRVLDSTGSLNLSHATHVREQGPLLGHPVQSLQDRRDNCLLG